MSLRHKLAVAALSALAAVSPTQGQLLNISSEVITLADGTPSQSACTIVSNQIELGLLFALTEQVEGGVDVSMSLQLLSDPTFAILGGDWQSGFLFFDTTTQQLLTYESPLFSQCLTSLLRPLNSPNDAALFFIAPPGGAICVRGFSENSRNGVVSVQLNEISQLPSNQVCVDFVLDAFNFYQSALSAPAGANARSTTSPLGWTPALDPTLQDQLQNAITGSATGETSP
ncbi:MAG: hypothetical protein ACFCBW_14650 [Candidatus Competibacterales bacterium]